MMLLSNHPGHGFLLVTTRTLLIFDVWVFLVAQWMAASMPVMLYYLMGIEKKISVPKPCGSGFCFTHKCILTHMSSVVECTLIQTLSSTEIKQNGSHCHPRPHKIKASKKAVQRLQDIVKVNSEAKPFQVMLGTPTREPAWSIHPSPGNLSRLSYIMSKLKSSSRSIDLKGILAMQHEMGMNFIHVCDLIQGVVVIQFPAMKTIIKNNEFYALQTNTIEGWILQGDSDTCKWNAHVTSVHCDIISRHVPVLVSLTRSRTITDYKFHFDHLFKSMECQSFDQFLERFPGNICDFSASEQAEFRTSLIDLATSLGHETIDVDKLMQQTYKFCEVSARVWSLACKWGLQLCSYFLWYEKNSDIVHDAEINVYLLS